MIRDWRVLLVLVGARRLAAVVAAAAVVGAAVAVIREWSAP